MINLLLLSAGTNACYHFAKILKLKFKNDFRIIGTDINELHLIATSKYLDGFYKVPKSIDKNFYETIINICIKEKIRFIIPSLDIDQQFFYPENKDLVENNIISLGSKIETLRIYKDKKVINSFLKKNNFLVPYTYDKSECEDNKLYLLKPIDGFGSKGVRRIFGRDVRNIDTDKSLIEEICLGPEITMECFCYQEYFTSVCRERIESKSGVCTKARVYYDSFLENIGAKFAHKLKLPYCFNLQFMKNSKNDYVITDVNLRMAGGMALSYAAGWDEVSALAYIMLNKNIEDVMTKCFPKIIGDVYVVRAYEEFITR